MKMGMIVDDAEEFPCGDRAVILPIIITLDFSRPGIVQAPAVPARNHSQGVTVLSSTQTSGTMCHS